jgi:hypothetical protein
MQPSLDLRKLLLSFVTVAVLSCCAYAQAPPPVSELSDQKAGSILFYPFYASNMTDPGTDTRIATTNTSFTDNVFVHIFMVSSTCSVADFFSCFTAGQTSYFLASTLDPGIAGYVLMVAVNGIDGCPVKFNYLVGDGFVKLGSGLHGNYGAEAIAAIAEEPAICDDPAQTALIRFDGVSYDLVPAVLALDNFPAIDDGYTTRIWVSRTGGNLLVSGASIGGLFGQLFNDAETGLSFTLTGGCQRAFTINDTDLRTAPRPSLHVPANSSGWIKFWPVSGGTGIFAFAISAKAGLADVPNAFTGGRNLHKLRYTTDAYLMPIFPPTC